MPTVPLRSEDFRFDPPVLSSAELAGLVRDRFGVDGDVAVLRGERDQNALVTTHGGDSYVLKVASPGERAATVDFQCRALMHIATADPDLPVPRLVATLDGGPVATVDTDSGTSLVRLLTFLPGVTFDDAGTSSAGTISDAGLAGIGELQGRLVRALAGFEHPAAGDFMPWALDSGLLLDDQLWMGLPMTVRSLVEPGRERVVQAVTALAALRRQVIHNDGHSGNLVRSDADTETVSGVIDFGDLVETAIVAELAVSGASFVPRQADPVRSLAALTCGFHGWWPLLDEELMLLPDLILARLVLSALISEFQIANTPHIAADILAERPDLHRKLANWLPLDPRAIGNHLIDTVHLADRSGGS